MTDAQKLCVFCGKDDSFGEMDVEHFVPKALWNDNRPRLTRTVPAHVACNKSNAADNEYFRDVLIVDERINHSEVEKLWNGKFKRRLEKRASTVARTFRNLSLRPRHTQSGIFVDMAPAFDVDWTRIKRVLANVMRGIFFTVRNRPLPVDCCYKAMVADEKSLPPYRDLIGTMTSWNDFGDDVFRCRYVFNGEDDHSHDSIVCLMQFYRCHTFFGMAIPSEVVDANDWHGIMA
jgi:hypothetical protein